MENLETEIQSYLLRHISNPGLIYKHTPSISVEDLEKRVKTIEEYLKNLYKVLNTPVSNFVPYNPLNDKCEDIYKKEDLAFIEKVNSVCEDIDSL